MSFERKKKCVVAAVLRDGASVLATQRGYGEWKGWWEFPGGKVQNGETDGPDAGGDGGGDCGGALVDYGALFLSGF